MEYNKNLYVLVFFYEEKKYSILKLKDAVSQSDLLIMDLATWDRKQSVETKWEDGTYPANFLQFGGKFLIFYFLNALFMP